jgi:hypothetical protein
MFPFTRPTTLMDTLPGPLFKANELWQEPEAQVPSPGDPLEPALPAEYSALLLVMLVRPKAMTRATKRTCIDLLIVVDLI